MRNPLLLLALAAGLVIGDGLTALAQTNTSDSTNGASPPRGARGRRGGSFPSDARMNGDEFEFRGGNLGGFMRGISQVFGYELSTAMEPSQRVMDIRVPSMKLRTGKVADVLDLYNQIAESDPSMGRWVLVYSSADAENTHSQTGAAPTRPARPPNSVLFVPPKEEKTADKGIEVKAITLRGMSDDDRKRLYDAILQTAEAVDQGPGERGSLMYNKQTDILVVKGRSILVDAVVRMVDAYREGLARDAAMAHKPEETKNDK